MTPSLFREYLDQARLGGAGQIVVKLGEGVEFSVVFNPPEELFAAPGAESGGWKVITPSTAPNWLDAPLDPDEDPEPRTAE